MKALTELSAALLGLGSGGSIYVIMPSFFKY